VSAVLELDDVAVAYGKRRALEGVSLSVAPGEIVTLLGANGAGKSTTLRAVSGLVRPTRGRIRYEGRDITHVPADAIVAAGVSHVPEGREIFPEFTVLENLLVGGHTVERSHIGERLESVFGVFPVLRDRRPQIAGTLSGGEQQMLAIGRALMTRPRLLLLDEPSLGLAPMLPRDPPDQPRRRRRPAGRAERAPCAGAGIARLRARDRSPGHLRHERRAVGRPARAHRLPWARSRAERRRLSGGARARS